MDEATMNKISLYLSEGRFDTSRANVEHPKVLIDYNKRRDRDFYYEYIKGAHESRFESVKSMSFKHVSSPDFKRTTKRRPFIQLEKLPRDFSKPSSREASLIPGMPKYEPKYGLTQRDLTVGIPYFSRMA